MSRICECGCKAATAEGSRFASRNCKDRARRARLKAAGTPAKGGKKGKPKCKAPAKHLGLAKAASGDALTREGWLLTLMHELRPRFVEAGFPIPERVFLSVGIPTKGGMTEKTGGECHRPKGRNAIPHIFISPLLNGDRLAAGVLVHELAHAATPKAKHDGDFVTLIRLLGCDGKPTHAVPSDDAWEGWLKPMVEKIGAFPHSPLTVAFLKSKQKKGRMCKGACGCEEPVSVYASRTAWEGGTIECSTCGEPFRAPPAEDEDGED